MKTHIDDVPKLRTESTFIEGQRYNQVRLGLLRLGGPIRLPLPGLRGMDLIIDSRSWVCVDRTLYDLPILAWTDFNHRQRNGLHEQVECLLHYYHVHADLITETVLSTMMTMLANAMNDEYPVAEVCKVFPLPNKKAG